MRMTRSRGITDPTKIRLSEHFLLSDFMGCNSVYTKGYKNVFVDAGGSKLAEGKHLCETLLEPLLDEFGPLSISYGYISPDLSKQIVAYQDPTKPSYHRWDKGAAADVCVHSWVRKRAPVFLAHHIDERYGYSRMITYSESPYLCLATQLCEKTPRAAFYENRYMGKPKQKPLYVRKGNNRVREGQELALPCNWKGAGYPTYHGGGIRQWHHRRVSKYAMMSDFLYSNEAVTKGIRNIPMRVSPELFEQAGECYDSILKTLSVPRLSIVRAYESPAFCEDKRFAWEDHFAFEIIPPSYIDSGELMNAVWASGLVASIASENGSCRYTISGKKI